MKRLRDEMTKGLGEEEKGEDRRVGSMQAVGISNNEQGIMNVEVY